MKRKTLPTLAFFLFPLLMGIAFNFFWFAFQQASLVLPALGAAAMLLLVAFFIVLTDPCDSILCRIFRGFFGALLVAGLSLGFYFVGLYLIDIGSLIRMYFALAGFGVSLVTVILVQVVRYVRASHGFWVRVPPLLTPVLAAAVAFSFTLMPYALGTFTFEYEKGSVSAEQWTASDAYTLDSTFTIEKSPDRDLVILNLTDIQLTDMDYSPLTGVAERTFDTIRTLVERTKPDLITISGDISCGYKYSTDRIVELFDSLCIPWAPVYGNHDHEIRTCDANYIADRYEAARYCLFRKGPADMGVGNYIINITEEGRVVHSLLMMDTHSYRDYVIDGETVSGYDHLNEKQLQWYRWACEGVRAYGADVRTTVIMHIPTVQYGTEFMKQWDHSVRDWTASSPDRADGVWTNDSAFGVRREAGGLPLSDNGFHALMLEVGSTVNTVAGHDHRNDFSLLDGQLRMTYALKTGEGCYWSPDMNGGTVITVSSDGSTAVHHEFLYR